MSGFSPRDDVTGRMQIKANLTKALALIHTGGLGTPTYGALVRQECRTYRRRLFVRLSCRYLLPFKLVLRHTNPSRSRINRLPEYRIELRGVMLHVPHVV